MAVHLVPISTQKRSTVLERGGDLVEQDTVKVSAVLGDPTRLAIYQYVLRSSAAALTTQDIAQHFNLHPNVARMHLTKLVDLGLLQAEPEKGGRGRPGLLYSPSGRAVNLSYPSRDFQLLSELLSETISALGEAATPILDKVGREFGKRLVHQTWQQADTPPDAPTLNDILVVTARALDKQGLDAQVLAAADGAGHAEIQLTLKNCGFREVASRHPELVCHLCQQIVQGALETQLEIEGLHATGSVPHGCKHCTYTAHTDLEELPTINGPANP